MNQTAPTLYFDYIDPLSWLVGRELAGLPDPVPGLIWAPRELRPPPMPLTSIDDPTLRERWETARDVAGTSVPFAPPRLVPWTRKAHEVTRHAEEQGKAPEIREAIFRAYLLEGRDIGRVDVLVDLAMGVGLDRTETKAVLDVDRHEAEVAAALTAAVEAGITASPVLALGGERLEGFHNAAALGTFLGT